MLEELQCPLCGGPMVSRKNNRTGQRFWGCKKYPECHGTRNTDGEFVPARTAREDVDESGPPSQRARDNDRRRWRHEGGTGQGHNTTD